MSIWILWIYWFVCLSIDLHSTIIAHLRKVYQLCSICECSFCPIILFRSFGVSFSVCLSVSLSIHQMATHLEKCLLKFLTFSPHRFSMFLGSLLLFEWYLEFVCLLQIFSHVLSFTLFYQSLLYVNPYIHCIILNAVWPDVGIKSSPNFFDSGHSSFYSKINLFLK